MASPEVIVVAPSYREAMAWAREHKLTSPNSWFPVVPSNYSRLAGFRGVPHVIIRWYGFSGAQQFEIEHLLKIAESPPYGDVPPEPEDEDELCAAGDLWS